MPDRHSYIHWPENLSDELFLQHYWQQKPLLIRQALPRFQTPISADELAGLAMYTDELPDEPPSDVRQANGPGDDRRQQNDDCISPGPDQDTDAINQPGYSARLVVQDAQGDHRIEYGPFTQARFTALSDKGLSDKSWSLLVSDVEKWLPELRGWLAPFRFLPQWRIDDLMISYAPDGSSVGAHVDEYDVFLLQASGTREWQIDCSVVQADSPGESGHLKVLKDFVPTRCWQLVPGDVLYLPPGIAHHGIAIGDTCTTWSVGFRSPSHADLVSAVAEQLTEATAQTRYRGDESRPTRFGQIDEAAIAQFHQLWKTASDVGIVRFTEILGCWLSENTTQYACDQTGELVTSESFVSVAAFSRLLWIEKASESDAFTNDEATNDEAWLFADGKQYPCHRALAERLCQSAIQTVSCEGLPPDQLKLVQQLVDAGSLEITQ